MNLSLNKKLLVIINKIRYEPALLLAIPHGLIIAIILVLISPIKKIRVGFLNSTRIGHFTENTENYLLEKKYLDIKNKKSIDLFYFSGEICNITLATLWNRKLIILPYFILRSACLIIRSVKFLNNYSCSINLNSRDVNNLYDKTHPNLEFTHEEILRGEQELKKLGIDKGEKFICLIVRDSSYLKSIYKKENLPDISQHNFRDCNINNFCLAAEELTKKGFFVIRMGAVVKSPFPYINDKIIDYAYSGVRTDFMDIFLVANCEFCISTGTGFDGIPNIFRKPVLYVNMIPFGAIRVSSMTHLNITKHVYSINENKNLSINDMIEYNILTSQKKDEYIEKNLRLIENTSEEVKDAALEMLDRVNYRFKLDKNDQDLHNKFWSIFPTSIVYKNLRLHGEIRGNIANEFLKKNEYLIK